MINVIIRTSYRPDQFTECLYSILEYLKVDKRIIVGYDDQRAFEDYIPYRDIRVVDLTKVSHDGEFFYNNYLNILMEEEVEPGHIIFIDDDDFIIPNNIQDHLEDGKSLIVPFIRGEDNWKPRKNMFKNKVIRQGYIGLPSLILWHEHKKFVHFQTDEIADFRAINFLSKNVDLKWVACPVVKSPKRNFGRKENYF